MPRLDKETLKERQKSAYVQYKQGIPAKVIAEKMQLSERMIFRYLDAYELSTLREWKKSLEEALQVTPVTAPVSQLLKVIKARK